MTQPEIADAWTERDALHLRAWCRDASAQVHRAIDQRLQDTGASAHAIARGAFRYLSEFLTLRCAADLLQLEVFPDAKELTESMAAYRAARNGLAFYGWPLNDPEIVAVFPGDGSTPRTAALFALRTAWRCISVDPRLRPKARYGDVRRLEVIVGKIEEQRIEAPRIVVVGVHNHAKVGDVAAGIRADRVACIMMPCCVKWQARQVPDLNYRDEGVLSPENRVLVWRDWRVAEERAA